MYLQNNFRLHPACQNLFFKFWNIFVSMHVHAFNLLL